MKNIFFILCTIHTLGAMCPSPYPQSDSVHSLAEEQSEKPFLLTEKERFGALFCGSSLGFTTALWGSLSSSTLCLWGGLGCLAATQVGLFSELCIANKKKNQPHRLPLPREYKEHIIFRSMEPYVVRDVAKELPGQLPGQVE